MHRPTRIVLPRLIQFMISHFINGAVLGAFVGSVLIWLDVGGLGSRLTAADGLLTLLYFAYAALLFGTLGMCVAVMNHHEEG